jgi:hypothetical protein
MRVITSYIGRVCEKIFAGVKSTVHEKAKPSTTMGWRNRFENSRKKSDCINREKIGTDR